MAAGHTVQVCKALLQAALDGGSWATAAHLMPTPDPLERSEFGGDEFELQAIHLHRKALQELRQKQGGKKDTEDGEVAEGKPPKKK